MISSIFAMPHNSFSPFYKLFFGFDFKGNTSDWLSSRLSYAHPLKINLEVQIRLVYNKLSEFFKVTG